MSRSKVVIKCDACKAIVEPCSTGETEMASFRLKTFGYGNLDGDHRREWDICSAECGLKLVKRYIKEIETGGREGDGR